MNESGTRPRRKSPPPVTFTVILVFSDYRLMCFATNGMLGEMKPAIATYAISRPRSMVPILGYRLQATGYRLQATGYRLQATGYRLQATGYRLQATGYSSL